MKQEEFDEVVKNNPEYKYSKRYSMYIDETATIVYALSLRGKHGTWRQCKVKVDEYTGYRYINHGGKVSLLRVLQDAWGKDHKLIPLIVPPYKKR